MDGQTHVAPLRDAQVPTAANVLARAFLDDPAWVWAIPDERKRARVLRWFFEAAVRYGLLAGEVHGAGEQVHGAIIQLPPRGPRLSSLRLMRVGLWQMPFRAGPGPFSRFRAMDRTLEERHSADVGPRHWYVWLIGVDPAQQRRGLGAALLEPLCERADREGVPCYLDTTRARNLAFYGRHGFEPVYTGSFPRGGPPYWTLLRAPRSPG